MATKDKAGKEERKKPKLTIKEKRKAKDEKKKTTSVPTPARKTNSIQIKPAR